MAVGDDQPAAAQDIFVTSWQAYDKILKNDYLSHLVLYAALAEKLRAFKGNDLFALLDLGCGDAHYISGALRDSGAGQRLSGYTGVDLAADALKSAMENVAAVSGGDCHLRAENQSMVDFATAAAEPAYDIALTSFAAHHLSTEEKQDMIAGVFRQLRPGGTLFVCDVFRREGESRADYLDRFCSWAATAWQALTPAELGWFEDHMRSFDFPEPVSVYADLAARAGFGPVEEVVVDAVSGNMKVLAFTKQA